MKYRVKDLKRIVLYSVLILAFANASLRFNSSGASTLFRLVSPAVLIVILLLDCKRVVKQLFFLFFILTYSIFVSLLFYHNIYWNYHINLVYIWACYVIVYQISRLEENFAESFFVFLDRTTVVILFLAIIQMITHKAYPFVSISPIRTAVNLFFSNENELGAAVACMSIIYIVRVLVKREKEHFMKLSLIIALLFLIDAKLCILGVVIGFFFSCVYANVGNKTHRVRGGIRKLLFGIVIIILAAILLSISNVSFVFRDYSIDINDLLLDYIKRIVKMKSYSSGGGSMIARTNAIIFGLRELQKTYFFGFGFGNSVYMLSNPEYEIEVAKSMHNIIIQIICEFGFVAFIGYFLLLRRVLHRVGDDANWENVLVLIYCLSFVMISSQSSIGILSNYMLWTITFYISLLKNENASY